MQQETDEYIQEEGQGDANTDEMEDIELEEFTTLSTANLQERPEQQAEEAVVVVHRIETCVLPDGSKWIVFNVVG